MPRTKYTPTGWSRMTKKQKRVEVARDVIAQLEAEWLKATQGIYLDSITTVPERYRRKPFVEVTEELEPCEACAIGAMFVTHVQFVDGATVRSVYTAQADGMRMELSDYFSEEQLGMIEAAFEIHRHVHPEYWWDDSRRDSYVFGAKYDEPKSRLIAIMRNIVRNRGTFRP